MTVSSLPLLVPLVALHLTLYFQLFMVCFLDCKFDALKAEILLCFVCHQTHSTYSRIWQTCILHNGCCMQQKLTPYRLKDDRLGAERDLTLVPKPD